MGGGLKKENAKSALTKVEVNIYKVLLGLCVRQLLAWKMSTWQLCPVKILILSVTAENINISLCRQCNFCVKLP